MHHVGILSYWLPVNQLKAAAYLAIGTVLVHPTHLPYHLYMYCTSGCQRSLFIGCSVSLGAEGFYLCRYKFNNAPMTKRLLTENEPETE